VACGLEGCLRYLEDLAFTEEDLQAAWCQIA
jgi:hypothetical protein